ncbi:MAG: PAS domain-containing protein [Rikenella sp.]|nr:PAS domain-containing protein [Rikenella sp.]
MENNTDFDMKTNSPTIKRLHLEVLFRYSLVAWIVLRSVGPSPATGHETADSLIRVERPQIGYAADEDYVLIFNSYSETAPWSGQVIEAVTNQLEELSPQTLVLTHNLNSVLIHNRADMESMCRQMDSTYVRKPRMIVYVGSISWVFLHEIVERKWGLVPSVILANVDFVGPMEHYLDKTAIPPEERIPFDRIVERYDGALNVVCYPMYVRETITMMGLLIPELRELCFISDGTWISAQMRGEVAWSTRTDFPNLEVKYLTSPRLSTFDLIDSLYTLGRETGILYCSWIKQAGRSGSSVVEDAPYGIISKYARQPVFVLVDLGVDTDSDVIGGYCTTQDTVVRTAREAVERSFSGEPGKCRVVRAARPIFDYLCMSRKNFDPSLLPTDTLFYWKPAGFFAQYRNWIFGGIGFCLLLMAVIVLLLRKRQQQRKALIYMDQYYTLFDNMPVGYAQIEILDDERGEIVDLVIRDVNPAFREEFGGNGEIIDRSIGEGDPLKVDEARRIAAIVRSERRTVTTFHYVQRLGKYYKVVFAPSHKARHIHIFCSDNTVLLRTEERLLAANRRLKTVLRTADVLPWRWELRTGTIHLGLLDPSKERGEETDADEVEESRFTFSVLGCFDRIHTEDQERVRQAFRALVEGKVARIRETFRIVGSESLHYEQVEVRGVVDERDAAGKPVMLVGSLTGIATKSVDE